MSDNLSRREFVTAGAAAAVLLGSIPALADDKEKIPHRVLGKTGVKVPILGLGTVSLGAITDEKEAAKLVNTAIDLGITYIDTAPTRTRIAPFTGYGKAQSHLKGVLKERRKEVFIVTKCLEVEGEKALETLKKNLEELGIEQADLVHTHSIGHAMYDFDDLVGDKGPMAALEKAKKDGLTRFVGVTGHNRPEKFAKVIEKRDIDAMMNACNVVDRHTYAFEDVVWPAAKKKNIGVVAMKVFGGNITTRPCKMPEELRQASLRYVLSIPGVALAVVGMASVEEVKQNVAWAKEFKALSADEAKELKAKTVELAKKWGTHLDRLDLGGEKSRPLVNT